ncbi:MAG: RNA polymerase sigma factor [Bacteroidota bacterium]|jgi:RNA polymerase sigma-70 factor (ECF subfamily)
MSTVEFNEALIQLEPNLRSFAMNFTRNSEDAKDLTQETMLKAITYRNYFTPQTNFRAWVFTIMRNLFINQYRRKSRSGQLFDDSKEMYLLTNSADPHQSPVNSYSMKEINRQLSNLEDEYKTPFEMHFQGFKYKEIAEKLDIPIGTVKSRIFVARKKLMDLLPEFKN